MTIRLRLKGWKSFSITKGKQTTKNSRGNYVCIDKRNFMLKTVTRDKGHYIMIKGLIHQENITTVNLDAPNWNI